MQLLQGVLIAVFVAMHSHAIAQNECDYENVYPQSQDRGDTYITNNIWSRGYGSRNRYRQRRGYRNYRGGDYRSRYDRRYDDDSLSRERSIDPPPIFMNLGPPGECELMYRVR